MRLLHLHAGIAIVGMCAGIIHATAQDAAKSYVPDQIDYAMFFLSDIRDTPECNAHVAAEGKITFGETITNPALSCPDAFAWKLFVEATLDRFWENWSTNRQTWPSNPWPRCAPGETGANCCATISVSNEALPEHCPVFPGPTPGVPGHVAEEPSKAHQVELRDAAVGDRDGDGVSEWEDVPAVLKNAVIGNVQSELIYRNESMIGYIFDRELYHAEGLARVYDNFVRAFSAYAPRWPVPDNPAASHPTPPPLVNIAFPIDAIMIKANWLEADLASSYGIDANDTASPFIVMDLVPQSAPKGSSNKKPHILLSFHISTKDVPNWFWATFEHAANQGRCDWLGCNDSFGYLNTETPEIDEAPAAGLAEPAQNFTAPHHTGTVDEQQQVAFVLADRYLGVDRITDGLDSIFTALGVGTGTGINQSGVPTPTDSAWRSYRLKGTQTNFVTATGRATRNGNSVTEAGFVNSASCISCHARAGATKDGVPPLAIFADTLSDAGIPESVNGSPVEAWFNVNAYWGLQNQREAPGILAVPTDFVWGFRNACPMSQRSIGRSWCANITPSK